MFYGIQYFSPLIIGEIIIPFKDPTKLEMINRAIDLSSLPLALQTVEYQSMLVEYEVNLLHTKHIEE